MNIKGKLIYTSFITLLIIIILSNEIYASELRSQWYWSHQTIDWALENVELKDKTLYIELNAIISIDNSIFNESNWITFTFSPVLYNTDKISSFKSSVGNANYKQTVEGNNNFIYNVSLKNLKGRNSIIFNANYTIDNRIFRIKDFTYGFFYQSRIETLNHNIYFRFPNNLEFIKGCTLSQGSKFQDCSIKDKDTKSIINFVFKDIAEERAAEYDLKKRESIFNVELSILFLVLGILLPLLINRNRKLFGDIEIKKFKKFQKIVIKIFKHPNK